MKLNVTVQMNLKTKEASEIVVKAARLAMRDTVVEIWNQSTRDAPYRKPQPTPRTSTGHNARSLTGEVSGMGVVAQGKDAQPERVVDDSKIEGAVYSTSGYGGFLETGTYKMAARPYIKPAFDKYGPKFPEKMKGHLP
jgi:hypothetical protein